MKAVAVDSETLANNLNANYEIHMADIPKCYLYRYTIFRDGKAIERNILSWKTALAHARKWSTDLFYNVRKIEIMNVYTSEIITLEEAERRAKEYEKKKRVNP